MEFCSDPDNIKACLQLISENEEETVMDSLEGVNIEDYYHRLNRLLRKADYKDIKCLAYHKFDECEV